MYIPHNTIRKAFYHFSALRNYNYNYFCYRCGHHAPILIADSNWKVAFDLPGRNSGIHPFMKKLLYPQKFTLSVLETYSFCVVHLMKRPDLANTTSQDTQVNISARWGNLEKEIIATGFCDGKLF